MDQNMTVKELKAELSKFSDDAQVGAVQVGTEKVFGINSVVTAIGVLRAMVPSTEKEMVIISACPYAEQTAVNFGNK